MINNVGWAMAVEKLMASPIASEGARVHPRDRLEMSRMTDHLTCVARRRWSSARSNAVPLLPQVARVLYELLEKCPRAAHAQLRARRRVSKDLPDGFGDELTYTLDKIEGVMARSR